MSASHAITPLLNQWAVDDRRALDDLTGRVYAEVRELAAGYLRRERPDHTLQPTALVNEAYLGLVQQKQNRSCQNRSHVFAIAAQLMRRTLVDHGRRRQAVKRSGRKVSVGEAINLPDGLSADLLALDDSLRALEKRDARKGKAVGLHYFGGLCVDEIAGVQQISVKTVRRDLAFAQVWVYQRMKEAHP